MMRQLAAGVQTQLPVMTQTPPKLNVFLLAESGSSMLHQRFSNTRLNFKPCVNFSTAFIC